MQFFENERVYGEWALVQSDENGPNIYVYVNT